MSDASGAPLPLLRPQWLLPATIAIIIAIVVNIAIIWHLLYTIPHDCALLSAQAAGRSSCSPEPGAYAVAGLSGLLIVAGISLLVWWHTKKDEIQKKPG
jgi:hypothetical protein